jgi:hypothetical protein
MTFSIVCCTHNLQILNENLLRSPNIKDHQLIISEHSKCITKTYNESASKADNEIVIFVHHDVYLPEDFFKELKENLNEIEDDWGVIGVAGKTINGNDAGFVCDRGNIFGEKKGPIEVQTLDELLLIKKKDYIQFDEKIPSIHHLFGTDICLQYNELGKKNYAISAFCKHNSMYNNKIPESWYRSEEYIKKKWSKLLPIETTCKLIV